MLKSVTLFLAVIWVSSFAHADLSQSEREQLSGFVKIYQSQKNIKGFLSATQNPIAPEVSAFLFKRAESFEKESLPKVKYDGKDTLTMVINGRENVVIFKSIIESKFRVNGKDVDLSAQSSYYQKWDALVKCFNLETSEKEAFMNWFLPKANADDNFSFERLAAAGFAATSIGILKDFEKTWKSKNNIFGGAALVLSLVFLDDSLCATIDSDLHVCYKLENSMNKLLPLFPAQMDALEKSKPVPECPVALTAVNSDAMDNFKDTYQKIATNFTYIFQRVSFCKGDKNQQLGLCLNRVAGVMKYLCIDYEDQHHQGLPQPRKPADAKVGH